MAPDGGLIYSARVSHSASPVRVRNSSVGSPHQQRGVKSPNPPATHARDGTGSLLSADVLRGVDVADALAEEPTGAVRRPKAAMHRRRHREVAVDLAGGELQLEHRRLPVVAGRGDGAGVQRLSSHALRLRGGRPAGGIAALRWCA